MKFDFRMKFYASRALTFKEFWAKPDAPFPAGFNFDFTDMTDYAFLSVQAYDFVEVTTKFVEMTMNHYTAGAFGLWSVKLTGHSFDPSRLLQDHTIVCLMQIDYQNASGVWTSTPWGIGFIGAIKSLQPAVSSQINGQFEMVVEGIGMYLNRDTMGARTWGKYNIAKGKNCTWSSTLQEPSILYNKGEFVGTQVTLGPENAVDGSTFGPPAVSANPPSGKNLTRNFPTHCFIKEVYVWPPSGYGPEYQWVAVSADTRNMLTKGVGSFTSHLTTPPADSWNQNRECYWSTDNAYPEAPGGNRWEVGLWCYSRNRVEELFDTSGCSWVVEYGKAKNHFISPVEDYIVINSGTITDPADDGMFWSTNPSYVPNVPQTITSCSEHPPVYEWPGTWNNGPINSASITAGYSLARRKWDDPNDKWILDTDTDTKADWMISDLPSPGYWMDVNQWDNTGNWWANSGPATRPDSEFAIVDLGEMNCALSENFNPTTVVLSGVKMMLDSTFGLSPTGRGDVNGQTFDYTERGTDYLLVTKWYGNTSIVGAGNKVFQYDIVKGVTKRGYRVRDIKLWRKPDLSHIKAGELHATTYTGSLHIPSDVQPNPTPPPPEIPYEWWVDWPGPGDPKTGVTISPNVDAVKTGLVTITLPYDAANPERQRYTKIMVLVTLMQGNGYKYAATDPKYIQDGGLFALNEIEVYADELTTSDGSAQPYNIGDVVVRILSKELGIPANKIYCESYMWNTPFSSQSTTRNKYQNVLSEMLQSYGAVAVEMPQGFIQFLCNPWWPDQTETTLTEYFKFDRSTIASVSQDYESPYTIAQAKVICRDPDGRMTYIGLYPQTPFSTGEYVESNGGTMIAGTQTRANKIAEATYKMNSHLTNASFTAVGPVPWLKPFMVVGLDWTQEEEGCTWTARYLWLVKSITHQIDFGTPASQEGPSGKNWITRFEGQSFSWTTSDVLPPAPPK